MCFQEEMSRSGLRTLVIGEKLLADQEYEAWATSFQQAQVALEDREGKIAEVSDYIEQRLEVLGATAVEDKLQVGGHHGLVQGDWLCLANKQQKLGELVAALSKARHATWSPQICGVV